MFTGLIEEVGTLRAVRRGAHSAVLSIGAETVLSGLKTGDSVAVNGVCLTVTAQDSGGYSLYFYRPEEDLTQGILQRSILKTWVRLSGGSCELRLYRPELSDANTVGDYPLVTVDQARQRLAAGQHLSAWEPFPGEDRVKRVDLQYLARQTDRYFMPYYVFWVECDDGEQGVCYRPYYVPAVADAYIAGMPQSPTGAA